MQKEELIEKYIEGTLSEKEKRQFDELLEKDEMFLKELHFHQNLQKVTEAEDTAGFREIVAGFEAEHTKESNVVTKRNRYKWLIAASIIVLFGIGYLFTGSDPKSSEQLFAENFEPYRNVVHPIVRSTDQKDQKTLAFISYEQGDYQEAFSKFEMLYNETQESYYLFYQANILLQLQRAEEAIPLLKAHSKSNDKLVERSSWYLAMAYLSLDNKDEAEKILQQIVDEQTYNHQKAAQLLEDLD